MSPPTKRIPNIPDGPPFVNDPSALVVIDWSWWLHKAWALDGVEMRARVVGWLCNLLAYEPAHVAIALDCGGRTKRHAEQHPTDPEWRYKARREIKPEEFFSLCKSATDIAELHSIPCLWADGAEGDDVIATVVRQARAIGYRVWICTADKDLHSLVELDDIDPKAGIVCGTYDNSTGEIRGPVEVREKFGVSPFQIPDLLAIEGDTSDNIPGVVGLGRDKAAGILRSFCTLEAALSEPPLSIVEIQERDTKIKSLAKEIGRLARGPLPETTEAASSLAGDREREKAIRARERDREVLLRNAEIARFSRRLTGLDCDVPIDVPWNEIPVGNFLVRELQEAYRAVGYVAKARQVASYPKRAPWAIGGAW